MPEGAAFGGRPMGSIEVIKSWQMVKAAEPDEVLPALALTRKDIPVPELKEGEALVAIAGCGVCGTDIGYFYDGIPTASRPPIILGHEISGTVVAGDPLWLGREVVVPTIIPCRRCELCQRGRANRCLRQKMPGNSYGVYGGFASHIPMPSRELCPVGDRKAVPLSHLAVAADAVATPYQAAVRAQLKSGDKVIVIGVTGGLGIFMAQWAKFLGAETVVGIGRNQAKLDSSLDYGVDFAINSSGKPSSEIRKDFFTRCRKKRIDPKYGWKIFEMTGSRQGQETALELLAYTGVLVVVGYGQDIIPYHLSKLMAFDAEIRGTWGCLPEHYPYIVDRILSGDIRISSLVETRPMSAIAETFKQIKLGGGSPAKRIILVPDF